MLKNTIRDFTALNRVLHEPVRLLLVNLLLAVDEAEFLYLLQETGLTKGNLSTHLRKLEEAGYVRIEKGFRGKIPFTQCSLTELGRREFYDYRRYMKQLLAL